MGYNVTANQFPISTPRKPIDLSELTFGPRSIIHSREYKCWVNMKTRCLNPKNSHYALYGGRGIKVCPEWLNSFEDFYEDMGPCKGLTIERIDVNGNYEPSNCRWDTVKRQQGNKTSNRRIIAFGEERILQDWANVLGMDVSLLHYHLKHGRTIEQIKEAKTIVDRFCSSCGVVFTTNKRQRKFCTKKCKNIERSKRRSEKNKVERTNRIS